MAIAEEAVPSGNDPPDRDIVLAVDDNEQNLQLLEEYLSTWGYDVVFARDGREALELYPKINPSIIVLDVMMPVMDGYEACSVIKAEKIGRTIPILMLTALTGTEDKIKALECGADDFLNKPINKDELRSRIRSLVRIRNLRRELDSSENIIMTLNNALSNKDPHSGGHVQRVAAYAARLCDKLGMSREEREIVVKGAMLHDVGMIGVPDALLAKSVTTDEERSLVAEHTRIGASILDPMKTFRPFVPIVRWHHERIDGRGYPDALAGEAIPLEARIVAIANRYDEIRHDDDLPDAEALSHLRAEARDGAWDAELTSFFAAALGETTPAPVTSRHMRPKMMPPARVLCVDDNPVNRDLVAASLAGAGFRVSFAENGAEAVESIDNDGIDVVLLDLLMPVMDGDETLRLLRADPRHQFLPIIVLTAHYGGSMRQEAIVAGADDFIAYPLNRLELITRIRSLLRIKDYHADLEQTHSVICALALALEAKDQYTRGHSQRVGDLARNFTIFLGLGEAAGDRVRIAGLLHDIGKIAVPESLLNKQGPLTREEFLRVIDHPVIGEEMVRPLNTLAGILRIIRHHHERYDGRGYPDGLRGEAIPYEVRLLSIVDAYDALTSHRSYRPAPLSHTAALETLRREAAGGKWDPVMVDQFVAMLGTSPPDWEAITLGVPSLYSL
ncbi:MAG TPA: HD domain-containing phosphohydrolase [Thermoanaerobaculia bacterium]|jgi:putative two-component system response regulator|nr:HD domain-containing phosphohydrolase [Thermoanaerobaculia bacterium]